jgi:hypothetical protein
LAIKGDCTQAKARRLAIALGLLLLASACATPVGVSPGNRQTIYRELTASVLSSGKLSGPTEQLLLRRGLNEGFEEDPEGVLKELRGSGANLTEDDHAALAELSYAYADKSGKRDYYLAAAVYAYAFLAPPDTNLELSLVDPRIRLAADIYNLGLTRGLSALAGNEVILTTGERPLPFGTLELETNPQEFDWGGAFRMTRFIAVGEFEVLGLRNRLPTGGRGGPARSGADTDRGRTGGRSEAQPHSAEDQGPGDGVRADREGRQGYRDREREGAARALRGGRGVHGRHQRAQGAARARADGDAGLHAGGGAGLGHGDRELPGAVP